MKFFTLFFTELNVIKRQSWHSPHLSK